MLQFIQIGHRYASKVLFDKFSWHIKPGSRVALVGPNGSGKSTLFRFATGSLAPESGQVSVSKTTEISLFQQLPNFDGEVSVIESALSGQKHYATYTDRLHKIQSVLDSADHESVEFSNALHDQSDLTDYANVYGIYEMEARARKILAGLGFSNAQMERKVKEFSPGYQHRLGLAITLLNPANLLLLDEPTNHLDDKAKSWLAEYLIGTNQSYVLVTHDPGFLNATTDTIAEINPSGVIEFNGSLDEFFEYKNEILEKLRVQFEKEESYLQKRTEWIERFRAKATKARQVQSVIKRLDKRDKVENPEDSFWNQKPDYQFEYTSGSKLALQIEKGAFRYAESTPWIFHDLDLQIADGDKIALVGPNGAGKSTFIRCLVGQHSMTQGMIKRGPKTRIGYFSQTHGEDLDPKKNLLETIISRYPDLSEVQARNLLGHFAFSGDTVYKSVGSLSGGEMSRLRLSILVQTPTNALFLDEPTNHLDIVIREALKSALSAFPGSVLVISHDPEFLSGLCNRTFRLAEGRLQDMNCSFEDFLKFHSEELEDKPAKENKSDKQDQSRTQKKADKNRKKKLEKEILDLEAQLERLEKNKKSQEEVLADPEFFKNRSYQLEVDNYNEIKSEIEKLTSRWENLNLELEELLASA